MERTGRERRRSHDEQRHCRAVAPLNLISHIPHLISRNTLHSAVVVAAGSAAMRGEQRPWGPVADRQEPVEPLSARIIGCPLFISVLGI